MSALPIFSIQSEFCQAIAERDLIVQAETGSGKSTTLPLWAASQGRVLVVQPRRIACESLASYLAQTSELKIGYAIRFASTVEQDTQVAFVTPGIALRWLAETGLSDFAVVILDEFHERRWDSDLLLALLKLGSHRLVLTSATINIQRLQDYLSAQLLQAPGRNYPVSLSYLARESHHLPSAAHLVERVSEAVQGALANSAGDLLVFLPGKGEIQSCKQALNGVDAEVLGLHGCTDAEQRAYLLKGKAPGAPRRVVLATNVAETSLTLPDIEVVIDSGLERRTGQRNGRTVLSLQRISKASAEQRKGRAGRLGPGRCYRLWGEFAPLESFTPPQLQREELQEPMLFAASCGKDLSQLSFLEDLPTKSLQAAELHLQRLGALDGSSALSEQGQKLLNIPLDSCFSHLISLACKQTEAAALVDICAALSTNQRLYRMPEAAHQLERVEAYAPLHCDAELLLRLMRAETLPEELSVNLDALQQARELAAQLRLVLALPRIEQSAWPNWTQLQQALLQGAPHLVFVRREKRQQAMSNGDYELLLGRDCWLAARYQAALVFDQFSLAGKGLKQVNNLASCALGLDLSQLCAAGLGELEPLGLRQDGTMLSQRVYAGRVIGQQTHQANAETVLQQLAEQILNGALLAPLGERLLRDCQQWNLWVALGDKLGGGEGEAVEAKAWLQQELAELGVSCLQDLELFGPEDFDFPGIPEWQRQDFAERYPSELSLAELQLRVEYQANVKQVVVHYVKGLRKAGPKRWELPRWSGWRVAYQKASKKVTLS